MIWWGVRGSGRIGATQAAGYPRAVWVFSGAVQGAIWATQGGALARARTIDMCRLSFPWSRPGCPVGVVRVIYAGVPRSRLHSGGPWNTHLVVTVFVGLNGFSGAFSVVGGGLINATPMG